VKVGDLVIPKDKGWKKYRKSMGIILDIYCQDSTTHNHLVYVAKISGITESAAISVLWFDGSSHRNEWSAAHLELVSEGR
jgi:hypothetical protein